MVIIPGQPRDSAFEVIGSENLLTLIRDAHETSRAELSSGRADLDLSYSSRGLFDHKSKRIIDISVTIKAHIEWNAGGYLMTFYYNDPGGFCIGIKNSDPHLNMRRFVVLIVGDEIYLYNPRTLQIVVDRYTHTAKLDFLDLRPTTHWLKCHPPKHWGTQGLEWVELFDQSRPIMLKLSKSISITKKDDSGIRLTRLDRDGGYFTADFSKLTNFHIESFAYRGTSSSAKSRQGEYQWAKTENGIALRHMRIWTSKAGSPQEEGSIYDANISHLTLMPLGKQLMVNYNSFISQLPSNIKVQNHISHKNYRTGMVLQAPAAADGKTPPPSYWINLLRKEGFYSR